MRFYLDEDLPPNAASIARSRGCDVISSHDCGRNGLDDETQLHMAASEGRCFVTRNAKDFVPLTLEFARQVLPHAGLLVVTGSFPGGAFARIAAAIARYSERNPAGMPAYMVDFLPHE